MFFLIGDVFDHSRDLRPADATGKIAFLTVEPGRGYSFFFDSARRIRFDQLHRLDDSQFSTEVDQQMHVVLDPVDLHGVHAVVLRIPAM